MEKIRLDLLISRNFNFSRHQASKAIKSGLVYVNHHLAHKKNILYYENSVIEVREKVMHKPIINYLEVNENFILLSKPEMLCCARNINTEKNQYVLNELVREQYSLSGAIRPEEFGLVHRLDKHTEGLMILSRNNEYYNILLEEFAANRVKKIYLAIVYIENTQIKSQDTVSLNLIYGKDKVLVDSTCPAKSSILSTTFYKIIKEYNTNNKRFAIVELEPQTGRRHQIRSLLSHLKMPIVGDDLYGGPAFHRMCLYSSVLDIHSLGIYYSLYKEHMHDINNLLMHLLYS